VSIGYAARIKGGIFVRVIGKLLGQPKRSTDILMVLIVLGAPGGPAPLLTAASALAQERGPAWSEPAVRLEDHRPESDLTGFKPVASNRTLALEIELGLTNQEALDQLLRDQQDPSSPRYHQWLTPKEFAARFGPTSSSFVAVRQWLKSQGFTITGGDIEDRSINFSGTAGQVVDAFGTAIVGSDDGRWYGNRSDPAVPARFEGVVERIEGLHNLHAASPLTHAPPENSLRESTAVAAPGGAAGQVYFGGGPPAVFGPTDLYTFYDEQPVLDANIDGSAFDCLALAEDSNILAAAVPTFNNYFNLAPTSLKTILVDGVNPGRNSSETSEAEALLDIEWAHVVAPGAPLRIYIGDNGHARIDSIVDAIKRAVKDNACGAISVSFGLCGHPKSFYTKTVAPIFSQAATQGQTIFIGSGDNGAAGYVLSTKTGKCVAAKSRTVNELSANPLVVSVGGTQFTPMYDSSGNDVSFVPESAWNSESPFGATGGGASRYFSKPAYQVGVTPADGARDVPDVAMIAGPPGVPLAFAVKRSVELGCCSYGTSLATPIWAAIDALLGARQGALNATFYANGGPRGVRNVISGNNSFNGVVGFSAGPGYNQATGFGSVDIGEYVLGTSAAREIGRHEAVSRFIGRGSRRAAR